MLFTYKQVMRGELLVHFMPNFQLNSLPPLGSRTIQREKKNDERVGFVRERKGRRISQPKGRSILLDLEVILLNPSSSSIKLNSRFMCIFILVCKSISSISYFSCYGFCMVSVCQIQIQVSVIAKFMHACDVMLQNMWYV